MARIKREPMPAGQRFLNFLSLVAINVREAADANVTDVAGEAKVAPQTIHKFEDKGTWPDAEDRVLAAYAQVAGLDDARVIYERALERWRDEGAKPLTPRQEEQRKQRRPSQRVLDAVKLQSARTQVREARGAKSKTTPKRQAGGE